MVKQCEKCNADFDTFPCHVAAANAKGRFCKGCRPTREDRKKQVSVSCAQCGFTYSVKESEHQNNKTGNFYCSQKCMGLWRTANWVGEAHHNYKEKIEVACCICGVKKLLHESQFKAYENFLCSNACRGEFNHRRAGLRDTKVAVPCAQCGTDVRCIPSRIETYEKAFCSRACHGVWTSENRSRENNPNYRGGKEFPCYVCGKLVWVKPSQFDNERHYCSSECSDSVLGKFTAGELSVRWKGGTIKRNCVICGVRFELKQAEANRAAGRYCSKACAGIGHRSKLTGECQWCGKTIRIVPSRQGVARFCSNKCHHTSRRIPKPMRKLHSRIHRLMYAALKQSKAGYSWEFLVGYTLKDLKEHIESLFWDGMSWENMGEWHLDHVRPRSSFRYNKPSDPDFLKCWALSNLQPLWKLDNLRKSSKLDYIIQRPSIAL